LLARQLYLRGSVMGRLQSSGRRTRRTPRRCKFDLQTGQGQRNRTLRLRSAGAGCLLALSFAVAARGVSATTRPGGSPIGPTAGRASDIASLKTVAPVHLRGILRPASNCARVSLMVRS
jgi:hypothetical protein